ncbi:aminoglycoside phosphotransferase (plasmid) [Gordonia bronchialis DSM 43247]|uniref:Aminoglycoside phosphotransferase n=1 Tax=Gordonia bronchialis (strain ATCC 25592 / DSM 43247 / BCRC 13721 / JCM 3198 / KCTC 3076 / NBRC 16047 / NCTC 10667) TaxID=526226 RepID=D0LFG3_GORB4|nr:phosphotransferase [Gordonia bronchialis]ACY24012.1 aminoglycoside phosphotransferase [Gordonia bronchialis DSM 43247]MCC3326016.1 phosphotransferase [Gordonia bronchialis]QGS27336.1 phosphotransferase [Gordonia bronchialis]STS10828.1 serine/threonine protein kinase [Gordonia bronchialis]
MIATFTEVRERLNLPRDVRELARQSSHIVLGSDSTRLVYRVASDDASTPCMTQIGVLQSHYLAARMSAGGLNVVAPTSHHPLRPNGYIVSIYPMMEPMTGRGWMDSDPFILGAEMAKWADFDTVGMRRLNVPEYVRERIQTAYATTGTPTLLDAARLCDEELARLQVSYPWTELEQNTGCVHGDPHLGNLVRRVAGERPLFIDLDYVAAGPALFDLAIISMYQTRYNSEFPFAEIASGYASVAPNIDMDELFGLRMWKELSSQTQLLTRWSLEGIRGEFYSRATNGLGANWVNVIGTPVNSG